MGKDSKITADVLNTLKQKGYIVEINLLDDKRSLKEYIKRRQIDEVMEVDKDGNIKMVESFGGI